MYYYTLSVLNLFNEGYYHIPYVLVWDYSTRSGLGSGPTQTSIGIYNVNGPQIIFRPF